MPKKKKEGIPKIVWFLVLVGIYGLGAFYARIIPEDVPPVAQDNATTQQYVAPQAITYPEMVGIWRSTVNSEFTREFRADDMVIDRTEGDKDATQYSTWMIADPADERILVTPGPLGTTTVIKLTYTDGRVLYYGAYLIFGGDLRMIDMSTGDTFTYTRVK